MADVYIDEKYAGRVDDPRDFVAKVKEERRNSRAPGGMNIFYDEKLNEIHIELSKGRARRPVIVVENGVSLLTKELREKVQKNELGWKDLVARGVIEYLDAAEEENAVVALTEDNITKDHTHVEISPNVILGLTTSMVPYANFGQSSRLNRGSKTQKQSLGFYAANFLLRMDTDVSVLQYPQKPIVKTNTYELTKQDLHPAGQNVTIAYDPKKPTKAIILSFGGVYSMRCVAIAFGVTIPLLALALLLQQ